MLHDRKLTEWQKTLDQDHKRIYTHAVQRLEKIFDDKQRYIHCKAPRQQGKQTKQHKKDLVQQCTKPWQPNHTAAAIIAAAAEHARTKTDHPSPGGQTQ